MFTLKREQKKLHKALAYVWFITVERFIMHTSISRQGHNSHTGQHVDATVNLTSVFEKKIQTRFLQQTITGRERLIRTRLIRSST